MKYTIITLNDERQAYKDVIRKTIHLGEIVMPAVDGGAVDVWDELRKRGIYKNVWFSAKIGELGVWMSNFDRWELASTMDEPLIVFEDDATPDSSFDRKISDFITELPRDWDFAALWVPEEQRQDYLSNVIYENGVAKRRGVLPPKRSLFRVEGTLRVARVYQGYGMIALVYSPTGGRRLLELTREYGLTGPVDLWIYEQAHRGNLNGFAPRPEYASIVHYDRGAKSQIKFTARALLVSHPPQPDERSGEAQADTTIDVVVPWVDGADPAKQAELRQWPPRRPWLQPTANRHRDNGELRFALRSIHHNLPWVRTIHVVTNGQVPSWLDLGHPRIRLIREREFFRDLADLPTFSSNAIEANLPWIHRAGVAPRFLLFNDDIFVGRPLPREFFQRPDGSQRFHVKDYRLPRLRLRMDSYLAMLVFNNALLCSKFGLKSWSDVHSHAPLIMDHDDLAWVLERFSFWFRRTSRHRYRRRTDALTRILYVHGVAERDAGRPGGAERVIMSEDDAVLVRMREGDDFRAALARLVAKPPPFFCINDDIEDADCVRATAAEMRAALATIFPSPAPFEKTPFD